MAFDAQRQYVEDGVTTARCRNNAGWPPNVDGSNHKDSQERNGCRIQRVQSERRCQRSRSTECISEHVSRVGIL